MEITIETATVRMLDALYELEKHCFKEEAFSKQQISYLLSDYSDIGLAARRNCEIVGFIIGRIDFVRNKPVGHIMTIDVAVAYRRKGIAKRLMLETESIFKNKGAVECVLEVREDNIAALGLYQKLGYLKAAVLENYYGKAHGLCLKKTPL
jgi:ribosomal-protein-alanine N-acetyltransferase